MREERTVTIDKTEYTVVISDETEALLAAKAAGRAIIGLWRKGGMDGAVTGADYLAESLEAVDEEYLEQVVRRTFGMPWIIGETRRLLIREFCLEDAKMVPRETTDTEEDMVFYTPEKLRDYIRCQYGFYEYGIWALIEKETGILIGKAGVFAFDEEESSETLSLELGYHIFEPYRRKGYGAEACREIVRIVKGQTDGREEPPYGPCRIYAKIDASNEASIKVIQACGFKRLNQRYTEAGRCMYLYVLY